MRQLAAIVFADMTGFTALMQENERLAREKRVRLKAVLEKTIASHNGKILQYYGDGSLSIFNSAVDSVRSAIDIQKQLRQEPKVDLRIGIHTGDIIIEEEAIFGDGVNMSSRIESLAVPGSIFISEKVADEIKNQPDISTRELGYFELKNVKQAVRIFAVANEGIVVPGRETIRGNIQQVKNRLAVLPFVNMSTDLENEYFSDGITEELLNTLTRVDGLQVTSRTSSFAFKNKNHDIRDIAIQLGVDKILEGSVRKSGNRVRITAQLINAADGYHLWSENYDRELTDIFQVQDEISSIITNRLRENLSAKTSYGNSSKNSVTDISAYTLYLKGLHFWNRQTPADNRKAIECFEKAIEIEPEYAQAYAKAAKAYGMLGAMGQMLPEKAFKTVHEYADKALSIDDKIAESHLAKASAYLFYDWKWSEAYEMLQKALQLNPGLTETYELLAFYNVCMGNIGDAVAAMEKAVLLDPLSFPVNHMLGDVYIFAERYDDAIQQAEKILEMDPQRRRAIELKAWGTGVKGDWNTALTYFQEVHRLTNHPLKGLMGLGIAYASLGRREEAYEVIRKLLQRQEEEPEATVAAELSGVYWVLGESDKAFGYLFECIDKRLGPPAYFLQYPTYKNAKTDPRYLELRKRMGL